MLSTRHELSDQLYYFRSILRLLNHYYGHSMGVMHADCYTRMQDQVWSIYFTRDDEKAQIAELMAWIESQEHPVINEDELYLQSIRYSKFLRREAHSKSEHERFYGMESCIRSAIWLVFPSYLPSFYQELRRDFSFLYSTCRLQSLILSAIHQRNASRESEIILVHRHDEIVG